jgi:hypothetical protein
MPRTIFLERRHSIQMLKVLPRKTKRKDQQPKMKVMTDLDGRMFLNRMTTDGSMFLIPMMVKRLKVTRKKMKKRSIVMQKRSTVMQKRSIVMTRRMDLLVTMMATKKKIAKRKVAKRNRKMVIRSK